MNVTVQHINNSKDTSLISVSSIFELIRLTTITNFCQLFLGRDMCSKLINCIFVEGISHWSLVISFLHGNKFICLDRAVLFGERH